MRISFVPMLIWLPLILLALVLLIFIAGQLGFLGGTAPDDLGVDDGKLKPPSNTENSVTSQAYLYPQHLLREYADIDAIELQNADGPATIIRIHEILDGMDNAEVVKSAADYLHAQFTSKRLKFVDDSEFWFDPDQNVIHVRSAARLGLRDFGMNRKHIEDVRSALTNK